MDINKLATVDLRVRKVMSTAKGVGISPYTFLLLSALHNGETRVTGIADSIGITQQAVGKILRQLKSDGFVAIEIEEGDKRAREVGLTMQGQQLLSVFIATWMNN